MVMDKSNGFAMVPKASYRNQKSSQEELEIYDAAEEAKVSSQQTNMYLSEMEDRGVIASLKHEPVVDSLG